MTLKEFFAQHSRVALGFSGGVDSSYLLWAGKHYGADIRPYFVKTVFQPAFELNDAKRLASDVGAELTIIEADILSNPLVCGNRSDRCYHCKSTIFGTLSRRALQDGYTVLLDGTNASDDASDRPGMRALAELRVLSPLRLCGLTKQDVRRLSKEAGLFTWDKPSYACLATRVPTDTVITKDTLSRVEAAEDALMAMGFSDFRVRVFHDAARIQVPEGVMPQLLSKRADVLAALQPYFKGIFLDLQARTSNE